MTETMEELGLPAGRYGGVVSAVELVAPLGPKPWRLRVDVLLDRVGQVVSAFTSLASESDDPYDVTPAQRKTLREFARRLSVQDVGPVEEIVAAVMDLTGHPAVVAHVRPTPVGVATTLYRDAAEDGDAVVAGEVLDRDESVEPEYRQRTLDAQGAHQQLLAGLQHAHRGLALAAEACWKLRQGEGWIALGYDSVGAYLADPDVSMSRSQFYSLADTWDQYVVEGGQDERRLCSPSKLEVPLPALKAGEVTAEEALADAEALGLRDLRKKYRGEPEGGGEEKKDDSGRPELPIACRACGVVIEDEEGLQSHGGLVYEGHRWPEAWSHDQVLAAIEAARTVMA